MSRRSFLRTVLTAPFGLAAATEAIEESVMNPSQPVGCGQATTMDDTTEVPLGVRVADFLRYRDDFRNLAGMVTSSELVDHAVLDRKSWSKAFKLHCLVERRRKQEAFFDRLTNDPAFALKIAKEHGINLDVTKGWFYHDS